ncbi:MAG: NAD(P)H-quinone oxidoreductase [Acidobacteria bacterium]|nr:NAD(P)H-quinone oxidoreductase [Acidobacteriota bacterium]
MLAIHIDNHGALVWRESPDPEMKPGHLLIDVCAAGVNRADLLQAQGLYPPPSGESDLLGLEVAGTIVAKAEDVSGFQVGERVFGLVGGGGYAQRCLLDSQQAIRTPEDMSHEEAACIVETGFTASEALIHAGNLTAGDRVLIQAGSSGVGTMAIQMAKLAGASSIMTTAGSAEKVQACLRLGADVAFNYRTDDWSVEIERGSVDLIVDFMGAKYLEPHFSLLADEGRLVIVGLLGGRHASVDLGQLLRRRIRMVGIIMRSLPRRQKAQIKQRFMDRWWSAIKSRQIRVPIHARIPMHEAQEAHRMLLAREHFGKVVLISSE